MSVRCCQVQRCAAVIVFAENQVTIGLEQRFHLLQVTSLGRIVNLATKDDGCSKPARQ